VASGIDPRNGKENLKAAGGKKSDHTGKAHRSEKRNLINSAPFDHGGKGGKSNAQRTTPGGSSTEKKGSMSEDVMKGGGEKKCGNLALPICQMEDGTSTMSNAKTREARVLRMVGEPQGKTRIGGGRPRKRRTLDTRGEVKVQLYSERNPGKGRCRRDRKGGVCRKLYGRTTRRGQKMGSSIRKSWGGSVY